MASLASVRAAAKAVSDESDSDVYFYNGGIKRGEDLNVVRAVYKAKSRENAILVLVTSGGDPDAAYKIARYLQTHYKTFTVLVSGQCKSAGTLIAVGADSIAFAPYGELGPIDVQSYKTDNLSERQSGLTITESIDHLTTSAIQTHGSLFAAIMSGTDAIIAFKTAAQAASELVAGLYSPIFSQIDPIEVGEKARSMRIVSDYGKRLNARSQNLKGHALETLTQTYPSHSFVIDMQEAQTLFENVRPLSEHESALVECLELGARLELRTMDNEPTFACLSVGLDEEDEDEPPADRGGGADGDGEDSPTTAPPNHAEPNGVEPPAGNIQSTDAQ